MSAEMNRREFVARTVSQASCAAGLGISLAAASENLPKVPAHGLTLISGKPRERGRRYGSVFSDDIRKFLNREIYQLTEKSFRRDQLLRYAAACMKKDAPMALMSGAIRVDDRNGR